MADVRVAYGEPGELKSKTVDKKSYDEGPRDEEGDLIDPNFDKYNPLLLTAKSSTITGSQKLFGADSRVFAP